MPLRQQSLDDLRVQAGELFDFLLPLVLNRRRRHNQHSLYPAAATQEFGGCERLHRLTQPHVVG